MSYWIIKDYKQALNTLYEIDFDYLSSDSHKRMDHLAFGPYFFSSAAVDNVNKLHGSIISDVFNFYTFIKNHPLVLRHQMLEGNSGNDLPVPIVNKFSVNETTVTPFERRLHFFTAYFHLVNGCPLLTLDVLSKLPKYISDQQSLQQTRKNSTHLQQQQQQTLVEEEKKIEKASDFDWSSNFDSVLSSKRFGDDEDELVLDLKYGDDDEQEEEDSDESNIKNKTLTEETTNHVELDNKTEKLDNLTNNNENRLVDMFAQQMKFIACLKILIEEMSTLATGFEVIGGQLR